MKVKYLNQILLFGAVAALTAFALTGCQPKVANETTPTPSTTTTETTTPAATDNPVEAKYKTLIEIYTNQIPAEAVGTLGTEEEQAKLVADMTALQEKKADSKSVHDLYMKGITKLAPEKADAFAAAAIAALRKNSFTDYQDLEKFAANPKNLDAFFKVAQTVEMKYVKLNSQVDKIEDASIKDIVKTAASKGYYISSSEGMLYPLVDFTLFAKYRNYNTPGMASLLETFAIDDLEPMMSDAAFIVDMDNVAARTWHMEKLMKASKGTPFEGYLAVRFKDHMNMLFFGSNNTPAYDYDTNRVTETTVDLFKRLQSLEGTKVSELTTTYMALLEKNDGKLDDKVRPAAEKLINDLDTTFGITKDISDAYGNWMAGEKVPKF